jgi:hypothetical protein
MLPTVATPTRSSVLHLHSLFACRLLTPCLWLAASPKTHTMQGPVEDRGVTYRAVETLFAQAAARPGTQVCVRVSMLQIYNEGVYDLLLAEPTEKDEFQLPHKLEIQQAPESCPWEAIPDLTVRMVATPAEVFAVFDEGNSGRGAPPSPPPPPLRRHPRPSYDVAA